MLWNGTQKPFYQSYFSNLLVGASSGLGEGIADLFSKCGASLALTGRNKENLRKVAEKCKESSPNKLEVGLIFKFYFHINQSLFLLDNVQPISC